jgi:hypothetical protein
MKIKIKVKPLEQPGTGKAPGTAPATNKSGLGFIPIKKESFIRKCIRIIIDDIKYKIYGETSQDRQMWNDYENFCKMIRGGK